MSTFYTSRSSSASVSGVENFLVSLNDRLICLKTFGQGQQSQAWTTTLSSVTTTLSLVSYTTICFAAYLQNISL